jgi:hypothetical protein
VLSSYIPEFARVAQCDEAPRAEGRRRVTFENLLSPTVGNSR